MNGKQSLAVVISAILSLAGVTGCSTTAEVKKTVKAQQNKNRSRPVKIARHVSDRQIYNEIYADAVKLGFDKRTMSQYKQRKLASRKRVTTNKRQAPRHKRYTKKYAQRTPKYKRTTPRANRYAKRYARQTPRYTRQTPKYTQRYARQTPRYTQRYAQQTPRYNPPRYRQVTRVAPQSWVRPAIYRQQPQPIRYRPPIQSRPRFNGRTGQQQSYNMGDMWNRVKGGFRMGTELHNPTVRKVLRQYASNPARLNRIFSRSTEYMHFILYELKRRGMPTELALLPMVESAFKNRAVSRSGAAGMWQFMPATGKDFGLHRSTGFDARMDIFASTRAALTYLQKINREFKGDWYLTLAAYNVGQNRIHRERAKNRLKGRKTDYWNLSLPKETREYVPRLLAYKEILLHPQKYGVRLPRIANKAIIAQANVNRSVDLRQVARMAGLPASTLVRLNPNFKNGVTNPRLSRKVVLPRRFAGRVYHALRNSPTVRHVSYRPSRKARSYSRKSGRIVKHRVRRGETLHNIAARYGTTIAKIMRLNRMRSTRLITGSRLKIATRSRSRYRG